MSKLLYLLRCVYLFHWSTSLMNLRVNFRLELDHFLLGLRLTSSCMWDLSCSRPLSLSLSLFVLDKLIACVVAFACTSLRPNENRAQPALINRSICTSKCHVRKPQSLFQRLANFSTRYLLLAEKAADQSAKPNCMSDNLRYLVDHSRRPRDYETRT